jgi:hydrogenase/urease accessory protein HupE
MVVLTIWSSYAGYFLALFPLIIGVACIWASYRLPVDRVWNMRLSGVILAAIGFYFLILVLGSSDSSPAIPGPGFVLLYGE